MYKFNAQFEHTKEISNKDNYYVVKCRMFSKGVYTGTSEIGWIDEEYNESKFMSEIAKKHFGFDIKVVSCKKMKSKEDYNEWKSEQ